MKDFADVRLETHRRIDKTERHNQVFIQSVPGTEGCLSLITLVYTDAIVDILDINLCKDLSTTNMIYNFVTQ